MITAVIKVRKGPHVRSGLSANYHDLRKLVRVIIIVKAILTKHRSSWDPKTFGQLPSKLERKSLRTFGYNCTVRLLNQDFGSSSYLVHKSAVLLIDI